MTPWFDQATAGLVGGILGGVLGTVFGAIGGGIGGPLASLGKARSLVLGFYWFGVILGVILAGIGTYALIIGQPWWVWTWIGFPGAGLAILMGAMIPVIKCRYQQAEKRNIDAQEFARSPAS